jgi:LacI family transcriptional regulator
MAEKLTIHDIATQAGVSTATVSRVLNNKPDVKPKTRERVLRVLKENQFAPNLAAAALAGQRSRLIGILVPSLNWSFALEIIRGIANQLEEAGYEIVLYTVPPAQNRDEMIKRISSTRLTSGLLGIHVGPFTGYLNHLHEQGFPVVMITDQVLPEPALFPLVDADHRSGSYEAVKHLLRLGHRRIAHIQGPPEFHSSYKRYQGYCDALNEAGIKIDPELVVQGNFEAPSGRLCANQILALPERPTAIFTANDEMGYGVLAAAEQAGLRIPRDLALVCFDDLPLSARLYPPLTTVRQPFQEMGQRAAQLLLSLVDAGQVVEKYTLEEGETGEAPFPLSVPKNPIRLQLPTALVVRESCGAVNAPVNYTPLAPHLP